MRRNRGRLAGLIGAFRKAVCRGSPHRYPVFYNRMRSPILVVKAPRAVADQLRYSTRLLPGTRRGVHQVQ